MSHQNQYALAHTLNQMKAQQLCNSVFFGPLNTLSQYDFLSSNNIKFFISVGIPIERAISYARNIQLENFLICCFDKSFDRNGLSDDTMTTALEFNNKHSSDLKILTDTVSKVCGMSERPIQSSLYRPVSEYRTNIFTMDGVQKFECFNDLITIFKRSNIGNILVFSSNGNDEELVTLLISHVLKQNPVTNLMEAFSYVKNLRQTIYPLKEDQIYWCSGLVAYHERVRSKEMYWGPGSHEGLPPRITSFATKRREQFDDQLYDQGSEYDDAQFDQPDSVASTSFSESEREFSSDFLTTESDISPQRRIAAPRLKRMTLSRDNN